MINIQVNHKDKDMSDQETLNRAFAQAVTTGTSTISVNMPNRAGKSALHRQMQQTKQDWFEPIESRYEITADEAEKLKAVFDESMTGSIKNQSWQGQSK